MIIDNKTKNSVEYINILKDEFVQELLFTLYERKKDIKKHFGIITLSIEDGDLVFIKDNIYKKRK